MVDMAEFGARIRRNRKRIGLSQAKVAEIVHVTNQAVSKWENGATLPDVEALLSLGELFGTSVESMLCGQAVEKRTDPNRFASLIGSVEGIENLSRPLATLARYFSREELFGAMRMLRDENAQLRLKVEASDSRSGSTSLVQKDIPIDGLSWSTLAELGPALYDVFMTFLKKTNHDVASIAMDLRCPVCRSAMALTDEGDKVACPRRHSHKILEHVIYFGTREDPGNNWSFCYTTYDQFVVAKNCGDNRLNRSHNAMHGFPKMLEVLRARRCERILEIGTGEGTWVEYLLKNIDWPCCILLTDLSHRILKYNRRYLSERYYNPYVSLIYLACDARCLPLMDESVDCVTSWGGYENMGADYDKGLEEAYRVLRSGGIATHFSRTCDDAESDLVHGWVRLLMQEGVYEMTRPLIRDRRMWEELIQSIGFSDIEYRKIKDEITPPDTDTFPYENEIMQWMGVAVIAATKK